VLRGARFCEYSGRWYCRQCHLNERSVIPARILQAWDFGQYRVSVRAKEFLGTIWDEAVFDVEVFNSSLYGRVKALADMRVRHMTAAVAAAVLVHPDGRAPRPHADPAHAAVVRPRLFADVPPEREVCMRGDGWGSTLAAAPWSPDPGGPECHSLLPDTFQTRLHLVNSIHHYSVRDFMELESGTLGAFVRTATSTLINHIYTCEVRPPPPPPPPPPCGVGWGDGRRDR
jgi:hypothetical protein